MLWFGILVGEFILLFISSKFFIRLLSHVLLRFTHSQSLTIQLLSLLFLPGVAIHELAHALMASVLFVPVGDIEFLPQLVDGGVKLGSVGIGLTDPLRRSIIGVAPVLFGLLIIFLASFYLSPNATSFLQLLSSDFGIWKAIALFYILFQISNTMFSSKKDMEGVLAVGVALIIIVVLVVVLGYRPNISFSSAVVSQFQQLALFLLLPLWVNLLGIVGMILLSKTR